MKQLIPSVVAIIVLAGCQEERVTAPRATASATVVTGATIAGPQVSVGGNRTCALKIDGAVLCWGADYGDAHWREFSGATSITQLSAGWHETCGIKTDGTLTCWGLDGEIDSAVPLGQISQVSAGAYHQCAVKLDGTVACWGYNGYGETDVPAGLASVKEVSAGQFISCALKTEGTVLCWGYPYYEETPAPAGLTSVKQVSSGYHNSCALKTDGTVVCWGAYGPAPEGLSGVTQVTAGGAISCALKADGTVVCWGPDEHQPGSRDVPPGLASVLQVSGSLFHNCALKTDGTITCWGDLYDGALTRVPAGLNLLTPGGTPVGNDLQISTLDQTTGQPAPVSLTFANVSASGTTTVRSSTGGTPPPLGFRLGSPSTYYDIVTTATFSGSVTLCFTYTSVSYGNENNLKLLHYENGSWTNVTSSLDTSSDRICGSVTSLSPFVVAEEFQYLFTGFFQPVDNLPTVNVAKAGSSIPVKFSLGADLGLNILAAGSPTLQAVACSSGALLDDIEQTVTAGSSSLSYNAASREYTYVWKTDKAWVGTCRRLALVLADASLHSADFKFK